MGVDLKHGLLVVVKYGSNAIAVECVCLARIFEILYNEYNGQKV